MILVAFAVFCLINAKRIIWNFEKSSLGRPLSETPPLKWRILLALLFLIASAFMAFTAYILLGDTLLGGAPCVVASPPWPLRIIYFVLAFYLVFGLIAVFAWRAGF